jgi:predicted PurR-regulated permease PerM
MDSAITSILKKLLLLILVTAVLYYAQEFLMPLAIAAVLATLFLPFCKWMEGKKVPRGLAVFLCLLTLLLFIAGIGALIGWQVSALVNDVELIKVKFGEVSYRIQQYIFNHFGISATEQSEMIQNQPFSISQILQTVVGSLASVFAGFILMIVYVFLLLYYRVHIRTFILKLFPKEQQDETATVIYKATNVSQQYLVGLSKMIACLWVMYSIGFSIVGVKNAVFFAILCGLLEIVPFVGNITGTTLTVLVSAVHGATLPMIIGIVVTYGIVQLIQGWVLEPLILGPQVKINPLFTIIALVLGELIWGIPGIILAIPITAMVKIVCDHIEPLKPYGFLIGEIESSNKESAYVKQIKKWFTRRLPPQ